MFGVHRLELAPGTMSGYIGVRPNKSKKHPWQAWLSLRGEKRRNVGSFKLPRHAAVARAAAKACGAETLRSPRKQAPRNKGAAACRLPPIAPSLSLSITLTAVCSALMNLDRTTLSGRGNHGPLAVRPERDLPELAVDLQRHERAAERASAEVLYLLVTVHVEWRAACPATAARPAIALRCGSRLHGCPIRAAGRVRWIWDRWARVGSVECARASTSHRTDSMWIMCG